MDEFDFIKTYLAPLAGPEGLNLQDDAALFTPPENCDLVITKDSLVEGVHFPKQDYSAHTAHKLLRTNLSDLAAKGAKPIGYLLSIAWPDTVDIPKTMKLFCDSFEALQESYEFKLFGGDTVRTEGPIVLSATFIGQVPKGDMVKRSGAKPDEDIWVSGTIGDGYLGLLHVLDPDLQSGLSIKQKRTVKSAYYRPEPRLDIIDVLLKYATASVDISDGLLADIGHIAEASNVSIMLEFEAIPLSSAAKKWIKPDRQSRILDLISAGDDYQIGFSAPQTVRPDIEKFAKKSGLLLSKIGQVSPRSLEHPSIELINGDGKKLDAIQSGYKHKLY